MSIEYIVVINLVSLKHDLILGNFEIWLDLTTMYLSHFKISINLGRHVSIYVILTPSPELRVRELHNLGTSLERQLMEMETPMVKRISCTTTILI